MRYTITKFPNGETHYSFAINQTDFDTAAEDSENYETSVLSGLRQAIHYINQHDAQKNKNSKPITFDVKPDKLGLKSEQMG